MIPTAIRALLAAVDDSGTARHAAERAASLAAAHGAELHLLQVLPHTLLQDLRQWLGGEHAAHAQLQQAATLRLQGLARDLGVMAGRAVHAELREGALLQSIGTAADAIAADLIVLGARGSGVLSRLALGSTAERMLRRSTRATLVVRQKPRAAWQRLLVAVDFSPWSVPTLALALQVAPAARVTLIHVFQVPFEGKLRLAGVDEASIARYREQARLAAQVGLREVAAAAGLGSGDYDPIVVEGDAGRLILDHEEEQDADLVVLGKHGRSAAEEMLLGSVTKQVLAHGSADVLVCPHRQD
ncbi:MAG: universal stress protein [Xanthomonadales bacterium]|jgi:nucleotide-binding universal stress UspA family protein|nr:universal stress protein [Xanthomonadales bacterium]